MSAALYARSGEKEWCRNMQHGEEDGDAKEMHICRRATIACQGAHGGAYSSNLDVRATEYDARKEKHAQVGVCARAEIPDMTP